MLPRINTIIGVSIDRAIIVCTDQINFIISGTRWSIISDNRVSIISVALINSKYWFIIVGFETAALIIMKSYPCNTSLVFSNYLIFEGSRSVNPILNSWQTTWVLQFDHLFKISSN